jgi:hypothetical protein
VVAPLGLALGTKQTPQNSSEQGANSLLSLLKIKKLNHSHLILTKHSCEMTYLKKRDGTAPSQIVPKSNTPGDAQRKDVLILVPVVQRTTCKDTGEYLMVVLFGQVTNHDQIPFKFKINIT